MFWTNLSCTQHINFCIFHQGSHVQNAHHGSLDQRPTYILQVEKTPECPGMSWHLRGGFKFGHPKSLAWEDDVDVLCSNETNEIGC